MGAEPSKPQPKQMTMHDVVFQLKMSKKRFEREWKKAEKDKKANLKKAKKQMKIGNEEGARLFVQNAQNDAAKGMKYLQMSARLDSMASTLKSNHNSNEIMQHLTQNVTPILSKEANAIPLEHMVRNFESFQESYDKISVTTNLISSNFDKMNMGNQNIKTSDELFNQLKDEVNYEMGKNMGLEDLPASTNTNTQTEKAQPQTNEVDDYINNLRHLG